MANYREQTNVGTVWQRCRMVQISNPYQGIPEISFVEEQLVLLPDSSMIKQDVQGVKEQLIDPTIQFDVLDPTTDTVVGQATYGQTYAILYSLYMALAKRRDAPPLPPAEPVQPPADQPPADQPPADQPPADPVPPEGV